MWRPHDGGIDLAVRLTPRAGHDRIDGVEKAADGREHLAVRVRAVPEKGLANAAVESLIARALHLPRSAVRVKAGATARLKTVHIDDGGIAVRQALEALRAAPGAPSA